MGKNNGSFRNVLKMGWLIHQLPDGGNKPYQHCTSDEKVRKALEIAFREYTGMTYTEQWYVENEKYI